MAERVNVEELGNLLAEADTIVVRQHMGIMVEDLLALLSEVKELRTDFSRMAELGNLARSRTTAEADELSALMTKAKGLSR